MACIRVLTYVYTFDIVSRKEHEHKYTSSSIGILLKFKTEKVCNIWVRVYVEFYKILVVYHKNVYN